MNEVELWTVAIGNLPLFPWLHKDIRELLKLIKGMDGFTGIYPNYPQGTLLLFDTENNAKGATNILRFRGVQCGTNICKVLVDKKYVKNN